MRVKDLLARSAAGGDATVKGWVKTARHGKGTYTYFAYAFHRQLPYGVPGAYRLLANLLSLGKLPARRSRSAAHGAGRPDTRPTR